MSKELPPRLIDSLQHLDSFDREAFQKVHASGEQIISVRINPGKITIENCQLPVASPIPWTSYGFYLTARPSFTFDPLFHAGCYYVQEASSMFLEQAFQQTLDLSKPLKVLDLCASPGGKSTHIQVLLSPESLLVSNEVIRSRANVLKDNIIKWGCENVIVTNNDPADFSKLENYFDVIVVDAPCSGSGLFRRDPAAIDEWSDNNVTLCSQRQQRILADVWPALKKEGILIYSTCSYSEEEDEQIVDWVTGNFAATIIPLKAKQEWGINGGKGCRFWPDKVKGEGFFIACFQKNDSDETRESRYKQKPAVLTAKETAFTAQWVNLQGKILIRYEDTVYVWPEWFWKEGSFLLEQLRVIYSGVIAGDLVRDKLVPAHALAMSRIIGGDVATTALEKEQAIQYLQRKDLSLETKQKGWQLVSYQDHPLGWINALPNRINNYYPKELRILKDS